MDGLKFSQDHKFDKCLSIRRFASLCDRGLVRFFLKSFFGGKDESDGDDVGLFVN